MESLGTGTRGMTRNPASFFTFLLFYLFTFKQPFYPFFLAMIIVTPARIARMPIASCREKLSPKTHTPMMTAVTGSKAPMMAAGVLPMRLMEMVMKKSDNTVGNKASWAAQSHCLGV